MPIAITIPADVPYPSLDRMDNFSAKVSFVWGVADLLRGDYKQSEYGHVILPFITLRRLDQVLASTHPRYCRRQRRPTSYRRRCARSC